MGKIHCMPLFKLYFQLVPLLFWLIGLMPFFPFFDARSKNMEIPILKGSARISSRLNFVCPQLFPSSGFWSVQPPNDVMENDKVGSSSLYNTLKVELLLFIKYFVFLSECFIGSLWKCVCAKPTKGNFVLSSLLYHTCYVIIYVLIWRSDWGFDVIFYWNLVIQQTIKTGKVECIGPIGTSKLFGSFIIIGSMYL